MILIKPSYEIMTQIDRVAILKKIELCGRVCYKSEEKITEDSAIKFVENIKGRKHFSVLEHEIITIKFICDRGVSHELVRHRIASFRQESTRYCNYSKDKFGNQLTFIIPEWCFLVSGKYIKNIEQPAYDMRIDDSQKLWVDSMYKSEEYYLELLKLGWTPQQARSVLPNSIKTEIVITANLREWQHIFSLRCDYAAHPQMRELMLPLQKELQEKLPEIF